MKATVRETVWGLDPRWKRIEYLDEQGRSLGVVRFEYRPNQAVLQPGTRGLHRRGFRWYAAIVAVAVVIAAFATVVMAAVR